MKRKSLLLLPIILLSACNGDPKISLDKAKEISLHLLGEAALMGDYFDFTFEEQIKEETKYGNDAVVGESIYTLSMNVEDEMLLVRHYVTLQGVAIQNQDDVYYIEDNEFYFATADKINLTSNLISCLGVGGFTKEERMSLLLEHIDRDILATEVLKEIIDDGRYVSSDPSYDGEREYYEYRSSNEDNLTYKVKYSGKDDIAPFATKYSETNVFKWDKGIFKESTFSFEEKGTYQTNENGDKVSYSFIRKGTSKIEFSSIIKKQ